jgi:hypothetical protein
MTRRRNDAHRDPGIMWAIAEAGGIAALAGLCGAQPGAVSGWRQIPEKRVFQIEAMTGIARWWLRPDLYQPPPLATGGLPTPNWLRYSPSQKQALWQVLRILGGKKARPRRRTLQALRWAVDELLATDPPPPTAIEE